MKNTAKAFLTYILIVLMLCSCYIAPDPHTNASKEKEQETLSEEVLIEGILGHLKDQMLSAQETQSLLWIVSTFTNKRVFERFKKFCADDSDQRDIQKCLKQAKIKEFQFHNVSGKVFPRSLNETP
jgi:hypothetical protein